jgi:hypothetical protein
VLVELARIFILRPPVREGAGARARTMKGGLLVMDTRTIAIAAFVIAVIVVLVVVL